MSKAEEAAAAPIRGARSWWMLAALMLGIALGIAANALGEATREPVLQAAGMIGALWLNALKMTVVPLIVALLVVGIAQGAQAMRAGRVAARAVTWFIVVYVCSAVFGVLAISALLNLFPLPASAAEALRTGLGALAPDAVPSDPPGVADFFSGIVPSNAIAAASNGEILQLVVFTLLFAMAATRIGADRRRSLLAFFEAVRDTLLVLIGWVLWVGPVGVFALAFALGSSAGGAAVAALLHYIVLLCLIGLGVGLSGYAIAGLVARLSLGAFAKAMLAPQSLAITSRSSLASVPAMLAAARILKVRDRIAEVTFPLIGALFRPTGPAMNIAVVFYVAHLLGFEPSVGQIIAAVAVASIISFGSVSLPGEISFIVTIAPVGIALGVPIAPLALLVAVEMIPDIFRTVGNVTVDTAVVTAIDRQESGAPDEPQRPAIARTRSE